MTFDEPIMVPCVGSGEPGHSLGWRRACAMCGQVFEPQADGGLPDHHRPDILAMIERGDYDD